MYSRMRNDKSIQMLFFQKRVYKRYAILLLNILFFIAPSLAQDTIHTLRLTDYYREGEQLLLEKNYKKARKLFDKVLDINSEFIPALRGAALCSEALYDYPTAVKYYEKAIFLNPRFSRIMYYEYANALYKASHFAEALAYFEKYEQFQNLPPTDFGYNGEKELAIDLEYAKQLPSNLVACRVSMDTLQYGSIQQVENLGKGPNGKGDDYFPFLSNDQKTLFYTHRKDETADENLFISNFQGNKWGVGNPLNSFNSKEHEGMTTLVRDGRKMYFTACNRAEVLGNCDIWEADAKGKKITNLRTLKGHSNSDQWDSQASISCDGSKLFFASNREGGFGGTDIWMSEREVDGSWSFPINLGPNVNTSADEEAPFITNDGQTLYFSSTGHLGLGEQDIFMCHLDNEGQWGVAFNLGPPVNSSHRELGFFLTADGKTGYFASNRPEGFGGMDIYKFVLSDHLHSEPITYLEGYVRDSVFNLPVPTIVYPENYPPIQTDLLGRFFICLPANKTFAIKINEKDYIPFDKGYSIPEWDNKSFYKLEIKLQPIGFLKAEPPPLATTPATVTTKVATPKAIEKDTVPTLAYKEEKKPRKIRRYNYTLYYDFDKSSLAARILEELDKFIGAIDRHRITKVEVIGYADYLGDEAYNLLLSEKRAKNVALFLTNKGIQVDKLYIEGKGEVKNDKPLKENRRVDVVIHVR